MLSVHPACHSSASSPPLSLTDKQANLYAAKVESTIWESTIEVEIVLDESKRKRKARSRARGRAKKGAEAAEGEGEGDGEVEGARRGGGGGGVDNDEGTGEEEDDGVLRLRIVTPLIGEHNVLNVLAAVATGLAVGVPLPTIGERRWGVWCVA